MVLKVIIKLIISAIIASNVGYTIFLLPILHLVKPIEVPLNLFNILAFTTVNTFSGLIVALITLLLLRKFSLLISITITVTTLWCIYWLSIIIITSIVDVKVLILDAIAAFILWIVMISLCRLLSCYKSN